MRSSSTISSSLSALALSFLAAAAAGCSAPADHSTPEGSIGSASVAITKVPTDVQCIEIDVTGLNVVTQRFSVKPGAGSVLTVSGIPLGNVDIAGQAWNAACSSIGAPATWAAQSVPATITQQTAANVSLTFFPTTTAQIPVDFENETYRAVTTFAGAAKQVGNVDGVGTAARFSRPQMIANDGTNIYVADRLTKTIRKIVLATATVSTIAGNAAATGNGVDGVGAAASFNGPEGVATDGAGNLFVTDFADSTIRKIVLATGAVSTFAGVAGTVGSADGIGAAASFNGPFGIVADGQGNLFVADSGNATIRKIVIATGAVSTFAGVAGVTGTVSGKGSAARFTAPVGIASDGTSLYVTDGSAVDQISLADASVFTLLGDPSTPGAADGYGGHFSVPEGIAYDAFGGNLFITDAGNGNVRQYSFTTGLVTTVAGSTQGRGSADGFGPAALFGLPIGVTVDTKGVVYVGDASNVTIRKM
jgi:sugar lactone lactonase YvrE